MSKFALTGRPIDTGMEAKFMQELRGPKLQYINAESELQVQMSKIKSKEQTKLSKQSPSCDKIKQQRKHQIIERFSKLLGQERVNLLNDCWVEAIQKWEYKEIINIESFPKYLFDDSTDLGYIISFFLDNKINMQDMQYMKAEELFFLEILCLNERNHLNRNILQYCFEQNNYNYIVDLINVGIVKMKDKLLTQRDNYTIKQESRNSNNDQSECQRPPKKKNETKTKPIKKVSKKGQKKKQEQQNSEQSQEDNDDSQNSLDIEQQKKLSVRFANLIIWAYYYILSK